LECGAEKVGDADARNLAGVLEGKEESKPCTGVWLKGEEVLPVECGCAVGDFVFGVAREYFRQGTFAGAVGTHDGVDFAEGYGEGEAFEDFAFADTGVEVVDDKGLHGDTISWECVCCNIRLCGGLECAYRNCGLVIGGGGAAGVGNS